MIFAFIITLTYGLSITNLGDNMLRAPHQYYGNPMSYYGRLVSYCARQPYSPYCQKFYGDAEDAFKNAYGAFGGYGQYGVNGAYSGMGFGGMSGMGGTPQSANQCRQFMQRNGFRYQQGVMTDSDSAAFKRMSNVFQMCQMMVGYGQQAGLFQQ